jgi:C_GCAxxG_C_C family probable redox protein
LLLVYMVGIERYYLRRLNNLKDTRGMTKKDDAVTKFCDGLSCSQAVLSTFSAERGLDTELAIKVATGFGGGMGRQGHTCGAVTGAIMVIGLDLGSTSAGDEQSKEDTYRAVKEFMARFEEECGSSVCKELLGCDISNPDGYARARREDLFNTKCTGYVGKAMELLEEVLGR